MSRNHRNRSWRGQWEVDPDLPVARHRSGVVAMVVDGEILLDATNYQGTREYHDYSFLGQATKLLADRIRPEEPESDFARMLREVREEAAVPDPAPAPEGEPDEDEYLAPRM